MRNIFYFTDIHGTRPLFDAIMNYCNEQDPEAMIIFGGDAIDRGPDGYQIMKELLDNPKVLYLKGNHEDMFVKAARQIKQKMPNLKTKEEIGIALTRCKRAIEDYDAIALSLYNGGKSTLTDWILDGMPMDIIEKIDNLQLTFVYNNCDFSHSTGVYKNFQKVHQLELHGQPIPDEDAEYLLWTRSGMDISWAPERIAIFGHTPTPYLSDYIEFKPEKDWEISPVMFNKLIPNAWKLDMDTGAVFTKRAFVLNVPTLQAQGFEEKNGNVKKIELIQF